MELPPLIKQLDEKLQGWPDYALTTCLLIGAVVLVFIAVSDKRTLKATALAWIVAP